MIDVLVCFALARSGCLRLLELNGGCLRPYALLEERGRSAQVVRCSALNAADGSLVTGGEDGIINLWRRSGDRPESTAATAKVKVEKKARQHGQKKPYSK